MAKNRQEQLKEIDRICRSIIMSSDAGDKELKTFAIEVIQALARIKK